jgi:hypothetical protein
MLVYINDITYNFPTCWNNETTPRASARRGDIISISIHNTKLRNAGMDRATVERDLMAAAGRGREVDLSSRHTRLYEKYRKRPSQQ